MHFLYVAIAVFISAYFFKHDTELMDYLSTPAVTKKVFFGGATLLLIIFVVALDRLFEKWTKLKAHCAVIANAEGAVYCGLTDSHDAVFIKPSQRSMHTQVVGSTNAGKTESVILPWAIQDIQAGRGLLIIDGKSDRGLLDKLYAYSVKAGREEDFRLFSLGSLPESHQFNPLIGGSPEEIAERVFNAFEFENPYYRSIQYEVFVQVLRIFEDLKIVPTFERLVQVIANPDRIVERPITKPFLKEWTLHFRNLSEKDRLERTSGLLSALGQFAFGRHADLFRSESPALDIDRALREGRIVYFQLPVLLSPFLGKACGKLVLQSLQAAIANRHREGRRDLKFFSVFLDDFTEYLYPGFVSILNKSRSANIGVVFAHQALGDIEGLGKPVANSILTNSNMKVFMRGTDPESAEYFSRVIGTRTTEKTTARAKRGALGKSQTGDLSLREVEEFVIHPNRFKSSLGVGEAFMVIPHKAGARTEFVKLRMFPDIEVVTMPNPTRAIIGPLEVLRPEAAVVDRAKQYTTN